MYMACSVRDARLLSITRVGEQSQVDLILLLIVEGGERTNWYSVKLRNGKGQDCQSNSHFIGSRRFEPLRVPPGVDQCPDRLITALSTTRGLDQCRSSCSVQSIYEVACAKALCPFIISSLRSAHWSLT